MREHGNAALDWAVPGYLFPIVSPWFNHEPLPPAAAGDNSCYVQAGWKLPGDTTKTAFPEKGCPVIELIRLILDKIR